MRKKLLWCALILAIISVLCGCGQRKATEGLEFTAYDGSYAVTGYSGTDIDVVIPDTYNDIPVTVIGEDCFNSSDIQSVVIGRNVEVIEKGAFAYASLLKEVHIPASVKKLGETIIDEYGVFQECVSLQKVTFDKDSCLESIGYATFKSCRQLKEIALPDTVKTIGTAAFSHCESLEKVKLPENLIRIEQHAFSYCTSIKNLVIPKSVEFVDFGAFDEFTREQQLTICGDTSGWYNYRGLNWADGCEAKIIME